MLSAKGWAVISRYDWFARTWQPEISNADPSARILSSRMGSAGRVRRWRNFTSTSGNARSKLKISRSSVGYASSDSVDCPVYENNARPGIHVFASPCRRNRMRARSRSWGESPACRSGVARSGIASPTFHTCSATGRADRRGCSARSVRAASAPPRDAALGTKPCFEELTKRASRSTRRASRKREPEEPNLSKSRAIRLRVAASIGGTASATSSRPRAITMRAVSAFCWRKPSKRDEPPKYRSLSISPISSSVSSPLRASAWRSW